MGSTISIIPASSNTVATQIEFDPDIGGLKSGSIIIKAASALGFFGGTSRFTCLKTPPRGSFNRKLRNKPSLKIEKKFNHLDPRFIFINSGFNLRPTDITAAIGHSQFKKLNKFIKIRDFNRNKIIAALKKSKKWNDQFSFFKINKYVEPSFFGFPVILNKKFLGRRNEYLKTLAKKGVETRPIISGNFLRQPVAKLYKLDKNKSIFKNADEIQNLGFFIGLHTQKIKSKTLSKLVNALLII